MKKILSVVLALMLTIIFCCLPVFAAEYQFPNTMKTSKTEGQYSASYDPKTKTLTYKSIGAISGIEENILNQIHGGNVAAGLMYKNSVNQKTQNEMIAYNDEVLYIAMSDIVRSGKVKTISIESTTQTGDSTDTTIFEYDFERNKKGQVIYCGCEGDHYINGNYNTSLGGREYEFSYDANGDLKSVFRKNGREMGDTIATFIFQNGKLSKISYKSNRDFKNSNHMVNENKYIFNKDVIVKTDESGRPIQISKNISLDFRKNAYNSTYFNYTYDQNGRLASIKSDNDETITHYNANGDLESVTYTSSAEEKPSGITVLYTYGTLS